MAEHEKHINMDVVQQTPAYHFQYQPKKPTNLFYPRTGDPTLKIKRFPLVELAPITSSLHSGIEVIANEKVMSTSVMESEINDIGREQRLSRFISDLRDKKIITDVAALRAWNIWKQLSKCKGKSLRVPDASAGPDDAFIFIWNKDEHHLELEIFPGGALDFFYRNRKSGDLWSSEYKVGEILAQDVLEKLAIF